MVKGESFGSLWWGKPLGLVRLRSHQITMFSILSSLSLWSHMTE